MTVVSHLTNHSKRNQPIRTRQIYSRCQTWEIMQPVANAENRLSMANAGNRATGGKRGKQKIGAKRGESCNRFQTQEKDNRCQAQRVMQPVSSAGKQTKQECFCSWLAERKHVFSLLWLARARCTTSFVKPIQGFGKGKTTTNGFAQFWQPEQNQFFWSRVSFFTNSPITVPLFHRKR